MPDPTPSPTPGRRRKRWYRRPVPRIALLVAMIYLGWCTVVFFKQTDMVFPRQFASPAMSKPPKRNDLTQDWIRIGGGGKVEVWFFEAHGAGPEKPAPCVVLFHGNAELIDGLIDHADFYLSRGISVCLMEYRGYGRSGGSEAAPGDTPLEPSERGIVQDAYQLVGQIEDSRSIDRSRLILHGRSLGAAVAAQLAHRLSENGARKPAGLILESAFTSVTSFAARFGVPGFLVKHPFRTDRVLPGIAADGVPILILHSRGDEIIPFAHAERLRALAPSGTLVEITGGHNDSPLSQSAYEAAIDEFLEPILASKR